MPDSVDKGEEVRHVYVDIALDAYRSFYDKGWAERFSNITETTKLSEPGLDLIRDWKGAAFTAAMPWVLIRFLDEPHRRWNYYMRIGTFQTTLWSSQRICYAAIYHAYENFLTRCVGAALNRPDYRPKKRNRTPTQAVGDGLNTLISGAGEYCLEDADVNYARLVRNALAHNGGRPSPEIERINTKLKIDDGQIHILPYDTRSLFDLLKQKVFWLAEKAKDHPQFQIATA